MNDRRRFRPYSLPRAQSRPAGPCSIRGRWVLRPRCRRSRRHLCQSVAARQERPAGEHELRLRPGRSLQLRYRRDDAARMGSALRQLLELPRWHGAHRPGAVQAVLLDAADELQRFGYQRHRSAYDFNDDLQFVYIGSYREYNSKFGQDQDATPLPVAQLDNELNHHAFTSEVRLNFKSFGGFLEGTVGRVLSRSAGHVHGARRPELRGAGDDRLPARPGHDAEHDEGGVRHGDHPPDRGDELHRRRALHRRTRRTTRTSGPTPTAPFPNPAALRDPPCAAVHRAQLPPRRHLRRHGQLRGRSHRLASGRRLSFHARPARLTRRCRPASRAAA